MKKRLFVYDEFSHSFRDLNKKNYNDDIVCGSVLLKREAISEIQKYFYICGYAIIEKENRFCFPIDIQKDKLVIFEGTYNCMPAQLQESLIAYNISDLPNRRWSPFFFRWQFLCDYSVFAECGSFIKLCSNIFGSQARFNKLLTMDNVVLYEPTTYNELCEFTRNALALSNVSINNYDYDKPIKYLIDSLLKGYHINFTEKDIASYFFKICSLVDERWD